jgi:hypothetical protein
VILLKLGGREEGGIVRVVDSEHMSGAGNGLHIELKWVLFKYSTVTLPEASVSQLQRFNLQMDDL